MRTHPKALAAAISVLVLGLLTAVAFAAGSPSTATTQIPDAAAAPIAQSSDDDGTPDQGRGDAPGTAGATEDRTRRATRADRQAGDARDRRGRRGRGGDRSRVRDDHGSSRSRSAGSSDDDGTADQGPGDAPGTEGSDDSSRDDHDGRGRGRGRGRGGDDD